MKLDDLTEQPVLDSETLFRRYAQFVASFLVRQGAPRAEIEDLVQEVFLTAHRKGGYKPGSASPTTFLARLALEVNHTRSRRAGRGKQLAHELAITSAADQGHGPAELVAEQRAARAMQAILDDMKPELRTVFILFELEGESCDAIAAGLSVAVGTVYSRLHAARRAFQAAAQRLQVSGKPTKASSLDVHTAKGERS